MKGVGILRVVNHHTPMPSKPDGAVVGYELHSAEPVFQALWPLLPQPQLAYPSTPSYPRSADGSTPLRRRSGGRCAGPPAPPAAAPSAQHKGLNPLPVGSRS